MYKDIENEVRTRITAQIPELSATRVSTSLDKVLNALFNENARHGLIIEFNGGRRELREPFKKVSWVWTIACVMPIRLLDTEDEEAIEDDLRVMVDKVSRLLVDDHTLSGMALKVEVVDIGRAEPGSVNDIPFYWLPFIVEATEHFA